MRAVIEDVRDKLAKGAYKNEEHVRVCIVLRILQALGWNIWNPGEVNLEFPVLPNEDQTRIDIALFLTPHEPSVFIEVKAVGRLEGVLSQSERQLRDYNRDNQALFSIITDGQTWRFYHSAARGEFANRCFKILNLIEHNLDDLEKGFAVFLSREAVETGNSEREATTYLQLSRKQRAMEDALPEAKRRVLEPPYPKLPEALIQLVAEAGISISVPEAEKFIRDYAVQRAPTEESHDVTEVRARPSTQPAASSGTGRKSSGERRKRVANTRMSSRVDGRFLQVRFEGGPSQQWPLPTKTDAEAIRRVRDQAVLFAKKNGATVGQMNAVKKALTDARYYVSR